jgi:hypothetical protein
MAVAMTCASGADGRVDAADGCMSVADGYVAAAMTLHKALLRRALPAPSVVFLADRPHSLLVLVSAELAGSLLALDVEDPRLPLNLWAEREPRDGVGAFGPRSGRRSSP